MNLIKSIWVNLWKKVSSMVCFIAERRVASKNDLFFFLCFWVSKIDHVWWRWTFNIFQPQNFKVDTWSAQEIQKKYNGWRETCHFCRLKRGSHSAALEAEEKMHLLFQHPEVPKWTRTWFFHYSILSRIHIFIQYILCIYIYIYISYVIGTDIYIYICTHM